MQTTLPLGDNESFGENSSDVPANRDGRDEMNLSEYPIALLADRAPNDVKTLVYKDKDETLTITGSDLLGLPTSMDIDVIIGLLYLTKKKNDFTSPVINFTRYELLQVLKWPHRGHYYDRVTESLNRWVGTTLIYKKSWWDNDRRTKRNASFHIIDAANVVERSERKSGQQQLPLSMIRWSDDFFRSCQANNLKRLDLDVYFSLKSSISKQLYRFLDKRFYKKPSWTFDLRTLACEHVGISRAYPAWKLKQKLAPAIEELAEVGFLRRNKPQERYRRTGRGEWGITLVRAGQRQIPSEDEAEDTPENPVLRELVERGISQVIASELIRDYPEDLIESHVEHFDWLKAKDPKKVADNPPGFLAESIRKGYGPPSGFESRAQVEARELAKEAKRQSDADAARKKREASKQSKANKELIKAHVEGLTKAEREKLDSEVLGQLSEAERSHYEKMTPPHIKSMMLRSYRDNYVRRMLNLPEVEGS